jgi:hypothetical protein
MRGSSGISFSGKPDACECLRSVAKSVATQRASGGSSGRTDDLHPRVIRHPTPYWTPPSSVIQLPSSGTFSFGES